jgi:small subunit ribosomal protein S17
MAREMKKVLTGTVISNKMDKTVVVRVARTYRHPLYGKVVKVHKKYHAHDENNNCQEGDEVRILETRPMSKTKRWVVIENLTQAASENA